MPILAPFAAANPDRVPGAVDIAHVEVSQFGDPGSGGIHRGQHGAVAEVSGRFQQRFDFLRAQDDRQLPFVPGQGNAFDGDLAVQRVGVEKPESRDDLDVGGRGRGASAGSETVGTAAECARGRVGLAASQNAWRIRQRREGWRRWLWVRSCESWRSSSIRCRNVVTTKLSFRCSPHHKRAPNERGTGSTARGDTPISR